jgi:SnoaL-like domain
MQQLWEIEQIKQLKAKYCYYVDEYFEDPVNFDRLMREVFVDDTELDFGEVGTARGRAAVEKFFRDVVFGTLSFSQHLVHSPLITFSGPDEAEGKWHFLVPCTFRAGNVAAWLLGTYDERYVRRGGAWYIHRLRAKFFSMTPFDQGWVKVPNLRAAGGSDPA